jgi:hypothetical protein
MIGGRRIVRPLGPDEDEITFSGLFAYKGTSRSDFLDSVRRRGDLCTLTWDNRMLLVYIAAYRPTYSKPYLIGYSITFCVVANQGALVDTVPAVSPAQSLKNDLAALQQRTACLGNPVLAALAGGVSAGLAGMQNATAPMAKGLRAISSGIGQVSSCINQVANDVNKATAAVAAPIADLLKNTQALITNAETAISSVASFGGIIPGNPVAKSVARYLSHVNTIVHIPPLYSVQSVATRMQSNLSK